MKEALKCAMLVSKAGNAFFQVTLLCMLGVLGSVPCFACALRGGVSAVLPECVRASLAGGVVVYPQTASPACFHATCTSAGDRDLGGLQAGQGGVRM